TFVPVPVRCTCWNNHQITRVDHIGCGAHSGVHHAGQDVIQLVAGVHVQPGGSARAWRYAGRDAQAAVQASARVSQSLTVEGGWREGREVDRTDVLHAAEPL